MFSTWMRAQLCWQDLVSCGCNCSCSCSCYLSRALGYRIPTPGAVTCPTECRVSQGNDWKEGKGREGSPTASQAASCFLIVCQSHVQLQQPNKDQRAPAPAHSCSNVPICITRHISTFYLFNVSRHQRLFKRIYFEIIVNQICTNK